MPSTKAKTTPKNVADWVITGAIAAIAGTLVFGLMTQLPYNSQSVAEQTQLFLERLQTGDKTNLKETFSYNLSERFTSQAMLDFSRREEITPLTHWTILSTNQFKSDGVANVQTPNGLLRFDYVGSPRGWQLQNFCKVDRFVEDTALRFVENLRSGNLDAAQQMTVDAAFPRRKGLNFPPERLKALQRGLNGLPETQLAQLSLYEFYGYYQSVKMGGTEWVVQLHHWHYDREGCQFFVFDVKQAGE